MSAESGGSADPPATATRSGHSRRVIGLLLIYAAFQLSAYAASFMGMQRPSAGFASYTHHAGEVHGTPVTRAAIAALESERIRAVHIRSANGHPLHGPDDLGRHLRLDPGQTNTFAVTPANWTPPPGQASEAGEPPGKDPAWAAATRTISVPVDRPDLGAAIRNAPSIVAFPVVGLLYVLLGLGVWWLRPRDRAAVPLLLFTLVPGTHFTFNLPLTPFNEAVDAISEASVAFYAPGLLNLALQITGFHQHRLWCLSWRGSVLGALLFATVSLATRIWPLSVEHGQLLRTIVGIHVAVAIGMTVALAFKAVYQRQAPGLQRRARILAVASLLSFLFPAITLILPPMEGVWLAICLCLLLFPVAIAYGIVSAGMFDIRFVIGPGMAYVALSSANLLAYVVLCLAALRAAGFAVDVSGSSSAPLLAITAFVVMFGLLSLGQLRLQGYINRRIFRTRYLYADAVAKASDQLARARSRSAITHSARSALLDAMRLSRAYVAVLQQGRSAGGERRDEREDERGREAQDGGHERSEMADDVGLACTQLGQKPDPITGATPADLPAVLDPRRLRPIARALSVGEAISAHDSAAASAQIAVEESQVPERDGSVEAFGDERTFWSRYGIEWIVPVTFGSAGESRRVLGLLLVGPKLDGRPLDKADRSLLTTLANQLAVAMENAEAFEQVRKLKDNLEEQVQERTRDLTNALRDLERAQGQLIESEKQAALGRLIAGIVHEVNSPLGSLKSAADTSSRMLSRLREAVAEQAAHGDERARRLLQATQNAPALSELMETSSGRLDRLMESLRRFVSLDESAERPFDVREGLDGALTLLSPKLGQEVCIERNYSSNDPLVACNPARLNQVFLNLLDNAATALNGRGTIAINVSRENGTVEVAVEDDGPGIDEHKLRELFEFGFTQKDGRVRLRVGLPSNKRAIEELGGQLMVESIAGKGTAVRVALPAYQR